MRTRAHTHTHAYTHIEQSDGLIPIYLAYKHIKHTADVFYFASIVNKCAGISLALTNLYTCVMWIACVANHLYGVASIARPFRTACHRNSSVRLKSISNVSIGLIRRSWAVDRQARDSFIDFILITIGILMGSHVQAARRRQTKRIHVHHSSWIERAYSRYNGQ